MRRQSFLAALFLLSVLSCNNDRFEQPGVIVAGSRGSLDEEADSSQNGQIRPVEPRPRITIDPADKVMTVTEANLDQDMDIEQVIAVKRKDPVDSPVRILIADSNSAKGRYYYQSCEVATGSTSSRVFSVSLKDLVGDHGTEILVRGMNPQGKLTLDVLKRAAPMAGQDLVFRPVSQIAADDISIEESERSAQYTAGQKNGESFPISASDRDPDSADAMDLIRVVYTWSFAEGKYIPGPKEKVPGEKVARKQLDKLFSSTDTQSFASFLDGSWVELSDPTKPGDRPRVLQFIDFQPGRGLVSRYLGDTMEIYVWSGANRLLYDRMLVTIEDDTVHTVARSMMIRAVSMDSIEVSIQEADLADDTKATCVRVTDRVAEEYLTQRSRSVSVVASSIEGTYQSESGVTLAISRSRIVWSEAAEEKHGYYVSYAIEGVTAITVRFLDVSGRPGQTRDFRVESGVRKEIGKTVATLTLIPIHLIVGGYRDDASDPLVMDRIGNPPSE